MDNIHDFVRQWNYRFPVDYWWRKKHKVAFNSQKHRNSNFWDMMYEYYEDQMYRSFAIKNTYQPNEGDWLNIKEEEEKSIEESVVDAMGELAKFKQSLEENS